MVVKWLIICFGLMFGKIVVGVLLVGGVCVVGGEIFMVIEDDYVENRGDSIELEFSFGYN